VLARKALAEDRLDNRRGNLVGLDAADCRLEVGHRCLVESRVGEPVHVGRERSEPALVRVLPAGEAERHVSPSVKRPLEAQDAGPPRDIPCDLHRVLDRLGSRVEESDVPARSAALRKLAG
jgi:hypothetical protein